MPKDETVIGAVKEHATIAAALASAQLSMGRARKDTTNPHFNKSYADLSSVMDACMKALNDNGIAVIQPLRDSDAGRHVVTQFIHTSGETLETGIPLIVGKQDMQGLGSAITYARRYGLMMLAAIAPDDDDGNAAAASVKTEREEPPFNSAAARDRIKGRIANAAMASRLGEIWTEEKETLGVLDEPHFLEVKKAFASRKAELEPAAPAADGPAPNADLQGDEIPY